MNDMNRAGVVGRAIADRLAEDGALPAGGVVIVEHATVVRIRVLNPDGTYNDTFEHVWSEGIDSDLHFSMADRMRDEARRRRSY